MRIQSEVGTLKKVLVHEPWLSLERLTPDNCHDMLFDDVLWSDKAREEHQVFQSVLKEQGVEVYLLHELLAETVAIPEAREWLLNKVMNRLYPETAMAVELKQWFSEMDAQKLSRYLIGGLTWDEADVRGIGLVGRTMSSETFVLPPLPNHLYTRDSSCWIGEGVSINPMYYPVRQGETHNIAAIYKFHPLFTENLKVWQDCSEGTGGVPSIEGGDVLVISPECVLIGLSERTAPAAVERLVRKLFEENVVQRVIGIEVPKKRACMHLDTVMTMIDHETFCVAFPTEQIRSWTMMPGDKPGQLNVVENGNVFDSIASTLGIKKLRLLSPSGDVFARSREQWTDASNLLAVRPGVVVAYDRNVKTNKLLKENGIEVLGIPGSELGRGRGGARCMSCSLERE